MSALTTNNGFEMCQQLVLQVRDGGRSALSAEAVVNINVQRNLFSPVCVDNNQVIRINFTAAPGVDIGSFQATDADQGQVSMVWVECLGCHSTPFTPFLFCCCC